MTKDGFDKFLNDLNTTLWNNAIDIERDIIKEFLTEADKLETDEKRIQWLDDKIIRWLYNGRKATYDARRSNTSRIRICKCGGQEAKTSDENAGGVVKT